MLDPTRLIEWMNGWPPELVWLLTLFVCFAAILLMLRLFGPAGLYVYIAVAIIGANIQVLKVVQFGVYADPVALGTILFTSTYLCTDILAESHGGAAARRGVWIGFSAYLLFTLLMLLGLGFAPLGAADAARSGMEWALPNQTHLLAVFTPAPAFFAAGMIAYLTSQFHDIWLYQLVARLTGRRYLWLRNNASTAISSLIDNTIFSVLAFVVFAPEPVDGQTLLMTFILGTWLLRLLVSLLDTPFLYVARRIAGPAPTRPAFA